MVTDKRIRLFVGGENDIELGQHLVRTGRYTVTDSRARDAIQKLLGGLKLYDVALIPNWMRSVVVEAVRLKVPTIEVLRRGADIEGSLYALSGGRPIASKLVCVEKGQFDLVSARFPGKAVFIENAVLGPKEIARSNRTVDQIKKSVGVGPGVKLLFSLCRPHESKRLERLVSLAAELCERGWRGRFKIVVAGHRPERTLEVFLKHAFSEDVEERKVVGAIELVDRQPAGDLLSVADIYVQTSGYESFGKSMLEAFKFGVPSVVTPVGVLAGSPLALEWNVLDYADRIVEYMEDHRLAMEHGRRVQAWSAGRFDTATMVKAYDTLIRSVLRR